MANQDTKGEMHRIKVQVSLNDRKADEEAPSTFAYLFSSSADLLDRKPVSKDGTAMLEAPSLGDRRSFRVVVGPETGAKSEVYSELMRRGAVEHSLVHAPGREHLIDIAIIRPDWLRWLLGYCCAKGRVLKRVGSGPDAVDLNVCDATVEVWEVDPWWIIIDRIPWETIREIRELVLEEVHVLPQPWPPDPEPFGPTDPIPWQVRKFDRRPMIKETKITFPDDIKLSARSAGDRAFRDVLVANPHLFFPIFCWRWPYWVTKTKVCETMTDCYGRFTCCFWNGWWNPDVPDLWFRVRQVINGSDTVIYQRYPVACHTFWEYECGTEVKLYVTNPDARTCCNEPPVEAEGNWVIFEAVGATSPFGIRGASLDAGTTVAGDNHDRGWTRGNAPFGGLIRPRLRFRDTLRGMGVMYYRASWAPHGTAPTNLAAWQVLASPVARHYVQTVAGEPVYETWDVGPKTVNAVPNLFEIPPSAPPIGDWAIPPGFELDDMTSAYFNTYTLIPGASAGKYDLKVELFDTNGAMVDLVAKNVDWFVPSVDNLAGTVFTDPADSPGLNLVNGNAFVITLHVDNNVCNAVIAPPSIGGSGADPQCGGLSFSNTTDMVLMGFEASHPNQFGTYSFNVYRGHANGVASDSGPVGAGMHSVSETVGDLLGPCKIAAFSENLYVYATATDGWRRLSEYDRADVFAFMLVSTS